VSRWAVDRQVVVSDWLKQDLNRRGGVGRVLRIHHGVEIGPPPHSADRAPGQPLRVRAAGRLVRGKGFDVLLRAIHELAGAAPIELEIAGDGPESTSLRQLAASLGVGSPFVGWRSDMRAFWRGADLAVVPSTWVEAFGMTAVEAMAEGLPVIVSQVGGLTEVVSPECGIAVPPGDASALAQAILRYAANPALRSQHALAAYARCARLFDIQRVAEQYAAVLGISHASAGGPTALSPANGPSLGARRA
jgi:glycosyltransferase involved in cell wall biosynthesis